MRGVTAVEAAIAVVLIGTFVGVAVGYQRHMLRQTKELALRADLQSVRASISFFEARRSRWPATLDELLAAPLGRVRGSQGFAPHRNEQSQFVDVFGSPYAYEPTTGVVSSTTPGYEAW